MSPRDSEIDVLDSRFPIRLTQRAVIFDTLLELRPDRPCARGITDRARNEHHHQERYVTPITPAVAYQYAQEHHADDDTGSFSRVELAHDEEIDGHVTAFQAAWVEEDRRRPQRRRSWRVRGTR